MKRTDAIEQSRTRESLQLPTADTLERFRLVQKLAYDCAATIAAEMQPGMSERHVAGRMKSWLQEHGVNDWFHQPFAWFGDRTAFRGFGGFHPAFYPSGRKLEENMPFILDCAPVLAGCVADIGYSGCIGENAMLDRLMDDLGAHRALILDQIKARQSMAQVSQAVDRLCAQQGVEPRHKAYPFSVLAHKVDTINEQQFALNIGRFGVRSLRGLMQQLRAGRREGWSPLWNSSRYSDHSPAVGLWAVEPHLGFRNVGAKFEELLVITEDDAFWLDNDLPHVHRWQQRQRSAAAPMPVNPMPLQVEQVCS